MSSTTSNDLRGGRPHITTLRLSPAKLIHHLCGRNTLHPAARAAYLRWPATGRRHPDVPIGYVFLFFQAAAKSAEMYCAP
ncbi:TerB N-terminal domain-containing protein [Actinoallomurus oryzae]|uniref:TerB N-terminal domain-containing protein n=1 Tax=Actinoallomurus oryzae TaxID=502180 RepID=UPI003CD06300